MQHAQTLQASHKTSGWGLDGVNPFADLSTNHYIWPVLLPNYNLPPWLVTKKTFVMLFLLISIKEAVKAENVDVYMEPLVEELQILWAGVAHDVTRPRGLEGFKLHAMLLWSILDFPAYGCFAGCVTKGYKAWPICGPDVDTRGSRALKNLYFCQRKYLNHQHPYMRDRRAFNGTLNIDLL